MSGKNLTQENITKEDVRELYKQNVISSMNSRIQSDDAFYDTDDTFDEISKTLNFSRNEKGVVTIPPELKWIEDVLNERIDDYPVLCWNSEIQKRKGATLEEFFDLSTLRENYQTNKNL